MSAYVCTFETAATPHSQSQKERQASHESNPSRKSEITLLLLLLQRTTLVARLRGGSLYAHTHTWWVCVLCSRQGVGERWGGGGSVTGALSVNVAVCLVRRSVE